MPNMEKALMTHANSEIPDEPTHRYILEYPLILLADNKHYENTPI